MKFIFRIIKRRIIIKYICLVCGKKRKKIIFDTQTVNQWNKNSQGLMKTEDEIWTELGIILKNKQEIFLKNPKCVVCGGNELD